MFCKDQEPWGADPSATVGHQDSAWFVTSLPHLKNRPNIPSVWVLVFQGHRVLCVLWFEDVVSDEVIRPWESPLVLFWFFVLCFVFFNLRHCLPMWLWLFWNSKRSTCLTSRVLRKACITMPTSLLFWKQSTCSPGWLQIHYIVYDEFGLVILQLLPPRHWDYI